MLEERLDPPPPLHELRLFRGSGGVVEFFCEASVVEMGLAPGTELSAVVMAGGRVGWARAPGPDQVWHSRTRP